MVEADRAVGRVEEHVGAGEIGRDRSRNEATSASGMAQMRDTSDFEMLVSASRALTRSSTVLVETPRR